VLWGVVDAVPLPTGKGADVEPVILVLPGTDKVPSLVGEPVYDEFNDGLVLLAPLPLEVTEASPELEGLAVAGTV